MASDHSTAPASPGLTSQVATLTGLLGSFVADLDPDTLLGADAAALYSSLAKLERLVGAAKCLLAPRIAASGHWEVEGHRSPAVLLATLEGGSNGAAKRTLATPSDRRAAILATLAESQGYTLNEDTLKLALDHLGLEPIVDLGMRLGEGTGAAVALPLVRAAIATLSSMATFEDAGVSGKTPD